MTRGLHIRKKIIFISCAAHCVFILYNTFRGFGFPIKDVRIELFIGMAEKYLHLAYLTRSLARLDIIRK